MLHSVCALFPWVSDMRDENGDTLLVRAVRNENTNRVRQLIADGVDVNRPTNHMHRPLMVALQKGNTDIAVLLLDSGAKSNLITAQGLSAVEVAATKNNPALTALVWLTTKFQLKTSARDLYAFLNQKQQLSKHLSAIALTETRLSTEGKTRIVTKAESILNRFYARAQQRVNQ